MLINGKDLLAVANARNFAVPAFNVSDFAMSNGLFEICEEKAAPWILAIHPDEVSHIGQEVILALRERAHRSTVPVAIHWDHGGTFEQMLTAIQIGFTSVMIDGSMLPFEENVAITRRVVDAAHVVGLSVEGELGTIGKTDGQAEAGTDDIIYTDPRQAVEFIERTGVDSLAIAIGTRHGIYPSTLKPELKLDLLTEIKGRVGIPLVLHGGSNNPDHEIGQSVKLGINKINISERYQGRLLQRDARRPQRPRVREPNLIEPPAAAAMKVVAAQKIDLFDAADKAHLYTIALAADHAGRTRWSPDDEGGDTRAGRHHRLRAPLERGQHSVACRRARDRRPEQSCALRDRFGAHPRVFRPAAPADGDWWRTLRRVAGHHRAVRGAVRLRTTLGGTPVRAALAMSGLGIGEHGAPGVHQRLRPATAAQQMRTTSAARRTTPSTRT